MSARLPRHVSLRSATEARAATREVEARAEARTFLASLGISDTTTIDRLSYLLTKYYCRGTLDGIGGIRDSAEQRKD